jgi:hypothetical protein
MATKTIVKDLKHLFGVFLENVLDLTNKPTKEADNKGLDQRYSGKGDLVPHEMPPKSIPTTIAQNASILQPGYNRAAVEDIFQWPRSKSVSQPAQPYTQMNPPVINTNLREK